LEKKSVSPLIDGVRKVPRDPPPAVNMTQHYNRPPLDPIHVHIQIQPIAATPGHHTITRSGGSSLIANSTSPTLALWLRCAPLA
jgi:hypothetical protein